MTGPTIPNAVQYLLDTNTVIALMRGDPQVVAHIKAPDPAQLTLCAPVQEEL